MQELSAGSAKTEKKRAQIRDAAKQLFLQHGFQGTSTDAILAAAGIASKETLYRYYARKEDLFVDVLRSLTTERFHLQQLMERSTTPQSAQELRMLLRSLIQDVSESMLQPDYLAVIRLLIAELPRFPQLGRMFLQAVPEPTMSYLQTLLRNGQAHGVVRQSIDPAIVGRMTLGTILTYGIFDGLLLSAQEPHIPDPGAIDTLVEHVMDMVSAESGK